MNAIFKNGCKSYGWGGLYNLVFSIHYRCDIWKASLIIMKDKKHSPRLTHVSNSSIDFSLLVYNLNWNTVNLIDTIFGVQHNEGPVTKELYAPLARYVTDYCILLCWLVFVHFVSSRETVACRGGFCVLFLHCAVSYWVCFFIFREHRVAAAVLSVR
jgi:hypothetical protein